MKTAKALLTALAIGALTLGATTLAPATAFAEPAAQAAKAAGVKAGDKAPDFTLTDVNGKSFTLSEATSAGKIVVLEWFNPDCPAVKKHHEANPTFKNLVKEFSDKDIVFVAINSGAPGKQGAGAEYNRKAAENYGITYPILLDEEGTVGKTYGAKVTPTIYIVNKDGVIAYTGAVDNGQGMKIGDVNYVSQALNEILAGQTVSVAETKATGCGVKYK